MTRLRSSLWVLVITLVAIEQGIKLVINRYYLNNNTPILRPWFYFRPMFNRDYSWVNSMLQLNVGRWTHTLLVALLLSLIYLFYRFLSSRLQLDMFSVLTFAFILAGAICSLVDKLFWDGSLDYIYVNGLFTFDLKDVYINVFIGLFLLMIVVNHRGIMQVDETELLRDFIKYLRK